MIATINGVDYQVDEGAVITKNFNETLDSATIRISHQRIRIICEPYDKVILHLIDGIDFYMEIDDVQEIETCISPVTYRYEISLFSQTKELEGIILPNLSITQHKSGEKLDILTYLIRYRDVYGKKYRNGSYFENKWDYSLSVRSYFENVECPEMQWNTPTFRDVLNDLMKVKDCIPVLENNEISLLDLTQKKRNLNNSSVRKYINYVKRSHSAADYVSDIKMNMKNVLQTSIDGIVDSCSMIQYPFVAKEGYLITSENFSFKTKYPINKIKHFYFGFWTRCVRDGNNSWVYLEQDLCNIKGSNDSSYYNLVCEEKEFRTKNIAYKTSDVDTDYFANMVNFQNFCFYFVRGTNEIGNLNTTNKTWFVYEENTCQSIITAIAKLCVPSVDPAILSVDYGPAPENNYYRPVIRIEYETLAEQTFSAGKRFGSKNKRTIIDNQTNSWVDAYTQGKLEYQKADRLGNKQLLINARFTDDFYSLIDIGDYFVSDGDNVVYQVQYQVYQNHINVNALACKDYILRDYFTGVKSKTRTWVNAQNEAFERHELLKYYVEFSALPKHEYATELHLKEGLFTYSLKNDDPLPLTSCNFRFSNTVLGNNTGYFSDFVNRIIGDSIVLTFGMSDNTIQSYDNGINTSTSVDAFQTYIGGDTLIPRLDSDFTEDYNGIPSKPISYVDNNMEIQYANFGFDRRSGMEFSPHNGTTVTIGNYVTLNTYLLNQFSFTHKTGTINNQILYVADYLLYKDNREIPTFSLQFEFCSDTKDITFTRKFIQLQRIVRTKTINVSQFKVYEADLSQYNWQSPTLVGAQEVAGATISVSDIYDVSSNIVLDGVSDNKVYYIVDDEGEILIATKYKAFFLNILKDRDTNEYDANGNIIGNIIE